MGRTSGWDSLAIAFASLLARNGRPLSTLTNLFEPFPQVLVNVPVRDKTQLDSTAALWDEVRGVEGWRRSMQRSRVGVVLRASGTEPVVRVMVEAADAAIAQSTADRLVAAVTRYLG